MIEIRFSFTNKTGAFINFLLLLVLFISYHGILYAENKGMDFDLQLLKQKVLEVESDLLVLEEENEKPFVIYTSMNADRRFKLEDLYIHLDGKELKHQGYEKKDIKILRKGYSQLVYSGELAPGKHELIVYYLSSKDYSHGAKLIFNKSETAFYIEIIIKKRKSKEARFQPELVLRTVNVKNEKKKQASSVFFRNLLYMEEDGRKTNLIAQIMKNKKQGRIKDSLQEYQLLLGRLYLSMGMYLQANELFKNLTKQKNMPIRTLNELWFYLAKSYFYLDELEKSKYALERAEEPLREQILAEKQHILTLILMANNKYDEVSKIMRESWWHAPDQWDLYARYNFSIALIASGQAEEGLELLKQTGYLEAEGDNQEALAMIDKVNQVLGFYFLKNNKAKLARLYLEKVRLHGPFSNISLLGEGWSNAMLQEYKNALVSWGELIKRDKRDTSVQEAMLVVPYAYEQIGDWEQAANYYQQAVDGYREEIIKIDNAVNAINKNKLQQAINDFSSETEDAWLSDFNLKNNNKPVLYYLKQFMDDDNFFKVMRNYRESRFLVTAINNRMSTINKWLDEEKNSNGSDFDSISMITDSILEKLTDYKGKAEQYVEKYGVELNKISLVVLQERKKKLYLYLTQARLALAQSYDQSGDRQ